MRYPCAPPSVALIVGIAIGVSAEHVWLPVLGCAVAFAWGASLMAFVRHRARAVCASTAVGFVALGSILGSTAERAATVTPLRESLDRLGLLSESPASRHSLVTITGVLLEDARIEGEGVGLNVAVESVTVDRRAWGTSGGVRLSVAGSPPPAATARWLGGRRVRMPVALRRPPRYLDRGVPDGDKASARRGTTLVGSVKSALLVEVLRSGSWASELSAAIREHVRRTVRSTVGSWSARSAGIVVAILIGDRAGLDASVDRRLQEAGTYHVIAISGGNMAILAGLLLGIQRAVGLSRRGWNMFPIVTLIAYAYLVGWSASVSRATVMAAACLAAGLLDHDVSPLNALAVAALLVLARTPLVLLDAGFILTCGATLGILIGPGSFGHRPAGRRWVRVAWAVLAASLSAEAALLPVQAWIFSRVTAAGLMLNFLAIPLMTLTQLAGMAAIAVASYSSIAGKIAGLVAHLGAAGLVESARLVDAWPWLVRRVPRPSLFVCTVYYAAIAGWLWPRRWGRASAGVVAGVAVLWMLIAPSIRATPRTLRVTFLDVGQGDSAFVEFPDGRTLLVDTGGILPAGSFDIGERVVSPALWWEGIRRLDYLAITHGDPDHMGGAMAMLRDFDPFEIWTGVQVPSHGPTNELRASAALRGVGWRVLQTGDEMALGDVTLRVLNPPTPDWERQKVRNDDSLVIEIRMGLVSVLLTGDVGRDVESELTATIRPEAIAVLKVPHHGSLTSSSERFIEAVRPSAVVFSAGRDNRFGHPAPAVLTRYRRADAEIFRTDLDGAVTLETDGRAVRLTSFNGRHWEKTASEPVTSRPRP